MLILASASPRRKELMDLTGYSYRCIPSEADETLPEGTEPGTAVQILALRKAESVRAVCPDDVVIGSDTVVVLDGRVLGKPSDEQQAEEYLRLLSGRTHEVFTGVAVLSPAGDTSFVSRAEVTFLPLEERHIRAWLDTGEYRDKAGAYAIQGKGALLIEKINGDYYTVMGLPVARTARILERLYDQGVV